MTLPVSRLALIAALPSLTAALAGCAAPPPSDRLRASGHIEVTEVRLAPETGGRVVTLDVAEGGRVTAGDRVLTLDTRDIELALQRGRAELAQAEAQWRLLRSGARAEDIRQAEAQAAAAEADHRGAEVELAGAEQDVQRFEQLLQQRSGTGKQRDDAVTRRDVARARVAGAADRLTAARQAVARLKAGARAEELAAASARIDVVRAQLAALEKTQSDATLRAPVSGVVTDTLVEVGELVAPRMPVVVVADLDKAWADVFVPEPSVPRLTLGQPATILTDAGGAGLPGTVSYISPRAEFTPRNVQTADERATLVFRVRVSVDNTKGVLKPGMPVDADLALTPQP